MTNQKASKGIGFRGSCARLVSTPWFGRAVLILILFNSALVGFETAPGAVETYGAWLSLANNVILALFVAELTARWLGHDRVNGWFLRDPWNLFDATVIGLSLVPGIGAFATVARLARVLRTLRLLSVSPELRLIVTTMMKSIPSLGHVGLLLGLLLYVYGVVGVNLFGAHDPRHWGSLGIAMLTLFQILTLEGWVEIQNASLAVSPWAWVFYVSFVLIAVFVVVNLFIAVVLNNLESARREADSSRPTDGRGDERPRAHESVSVYEKGEGSHKEVPGSAGRISRVDRVGRARGGGRPKRSHGGADRDGERSD